MPSVHMSINRDLMARYMAKFPGLPIGDFFRQTLEDALNNSSTIQKNTNTKTEKEIAQIKKINLENANLTLEIWKKSKDLNIPITLEQLTAIVNGKQVLDIPKTLQATQSPETKPAVDGPLDLTRGAFVCRECRPNFVFQYQENDKLDMINKSEEFRGHVLKNHDRNLSSLEKSTIMKFLDEVNMK